MPEKQIKAPGTSAVRTVIRSRVARTYSGGGSGEYSRSSCHTKSQRRQMKSRSVREGHLQGICSTDQHGTELDMEVWCSVERALTEVGDSGLTNFSQFRWLIGQAPPSRRGSRCNGRAGHISLSTGVIEPTGLRDVVITRSG